MPDSVISDPAEVVLRAVRMVVDTFDMMQGGELLVPRIPSMKVTDLAQAIADAGVNLAACYVASRSRVVFSSHDPAALRSALGM